MNDQDITKLAAKLTQSLATKDDIKMIEKRFEMVGKKFEMVRDKFEELNEKADTILKFAEAVNETTDNHEKRLRNIERIPVVAHELRKN